MLCCSANAVAQYGNNYGYGSGSLNNRIPNVPRENTKPSAADIEKNRKERVDKMMEKLKADLTLDELQFIAIKNDMLTSFKAMDIVMKSENSDEDKSNEVKAIQEKTEKSVLSYLNATQKEKYLKIKEDRAAGKEKKKKRKEKEKEETPE